VGERNVRLAAINAYLSAYSSMEGHTTVGLPLGSVVRAELALVALRAVDQDLIVRRQPRSPAALVLERDTTALNALEAVRVRGPGLEHREPCTASCTDLT
jgi:hypothetical protein